MNIPPYSEDDPRDRDERDERMNEPEQGWPEEAEQLTLADEDERLPWLESDEDYEDGGLDMTRLVIVGLIGLLVVLGLLAAVWWFTQAGPDEELLAEGSTIEAPEGPFRTRPDDPGGAEVAGTGDLSFEVGEGQSRDAVLGQNASATDGRAAGAIPRPTIDRDQDAAGTGRPTNSATGGDSVGVQVAAFTSRARAEQGWRDLTNRFDALQGVNYRVVEATVDGATVYRLQALADTVAGADALCRALKAAGGDCQVMR